MAGSAPRISSHSNLGLVIVETFRRCHEGLPIRRSLVSREADELRRFAVVGTTDSGLLAAMPCLSAPPVTETPPANGIIDFTAYQSGIAEIVCPSNSLDFI